MKGLLQEREAYPHFTGLGWFWVDVVVRPYGAGAMQSHSHRRPDYLHLHAMWRTPHMHGRLSYASQIRTRSSSRC